LFTHRPIDRQLVHKVREMLPTAHDDKTEKEPDPSSSKAQILQASLERTKKRQLLETRTTDVPSDEAVAVSPFSSHHQRTSLPDFNCTVLFRLDGPAFSLLPAYFHSVLVLFLVLCTSCILIAGFNIISDLMIYLNALNNDWCWYCW